MVVTIIILLILAGVAIAQLTGNGLFEKAKLAKEKQENAQIEEDATLADYENKLGEYVDGSREQITVDKEEYEQLKKDVANLKIQNTMSYEEHFTGEYYLDGKPIYAKTINCGNYPNKERKQVNHNVKNYGTIWIDTSNSYVINSTDSFLPCVYLNTESKGLGTYIKGDYIYLVAADDRTGFTGIITVKYTKTTD